MAKIRKQNVSNPNNWLYSDTPHMIWWGCDGWIEIVWRDFFKRAMIPDTAPDFPECTNDEKIQWEAEHPIPECDEPEEPEGE